MGATEIGWTDFSTNPWRARRAGSTATKGGYASGVGHYCEKISAGCKNCYSSALQPKFGLPVFQEQRGGAVESFFDASKLDEVLRRRKPTKIFWCDMTDMFGSWVPFEWIAACFGVMAATPHHTHQVLTKRPARALAFFGWLDERAAAAGSFRVAICAAQASQMMNRPADFMPDLVSEWPSWPLPSVHIGVSVEDQQRADERIPLLLKCPAAVRWISAEPLLSEVDLDMGRCETHDRDFVEIGDLGEYCSECGAEGASGELSYGHWLDACADIDQPGINWVVVGGESGAGHRPVDPAWVDSIVAQCTTAGVPVFVKQDSGPKPGRQGRLSAETWARKEFPPPAREVAHHAV